MEHEEHNQLPYNLVRRIVTLTLVVGLLGGAAGSYVVVRYLPALIPVSKQAIVLQENSAAVDVAKKVSPSVVSITSQSTGFSFFGQSQTTKGAGTGIIVGSDGLILTNNHVIDGASELDVYTSDGKRYKNAKVIATDAQNDLAFIKVDAHGLKAAELGDSSSVAVGNKVVAIGNALGQFQNTVTEGIISGLGRPVTAGDQTGGSEEQLQNLFQTDAAINPGNSGGPLVNLEGKVIGINTAVAGDAQNIGFAIPINQAKIELAQVQKAGKITKPYLGVRYIPITKEFAASNNLPVTQGGYITGDNQNLAVVPGSPAAKSGLKEGDIITKIGGQTLDATHSLSLLISQHKVGDKVKIEYLRDGQSKSVDVALEEAPRS
ncbi:MAG TPA: trypsin-like peptidase domain-containing protein [Candidatus Saccharimonadales bacterium]|nr:trypsin-like peptidase domain-containing protein [Candidatus Saccharimonadales bacterium]